MLVGQINYYVWNYYRLWTKMINIYSLSLKMFRIFFWFGLFCFLIMTYYSDSASSAHSQSHSHGDGDPDRGYRSLVLLLDWLYFFLISLDLGIWLWIVIFFKLSKQFVLFTGILKLCCVIIVMGDSTLSRNELIGIVLKISILTVASYISMKWVLSQIDPTRKQKNGAKVKAQNLLKKLGFLDSASLNEYEIVIASHLVIPSEIQISWQHIAGLEDIIQELKETVILPIKRTDLFTSSQLTRAPKGILLHGPPGCGKTLIAKATAREAGTNFINLDVSMLTDKWYGESQKLAGAVFSLAVKLQPCIVFIDEIDSFLRVRNSHDHEATAMMKAQFMALWDGLATDPDCTVIVMGATNRPQDLDKAILRRMPATFHISLPKLSQRVAIFKLILDGEPTSSDVNIDQLARMTESFSGSDIRELCRNASVYRVRDYMRTGADPAARSGEAESDGEEFHDALRPITMEDLTLSLDKMKKSRAHCGQPALANIPLD